MIRLLLIGPFLPLIWCCHVMQRSDMLKERYKNRHQKKGIIERCCNIRRPGAINNIPEVISEMYPSDEGFSWYLHSYMACLIQLGCCELEFTKNLTVHEAINRYVEGNKKTFNDLLENIEKNRYLTFLIEHLSQKEPKFYFRILPSGSIREGFGYPLPSTSVLASDMICCLFLTVFLFMTSLQNARTISGFLYRSR